MTPSPRPLLVALALAACVLVGTAACGSGDGAGTAAAQGGEVASGRVTVDGATIDWPANPRVAAVRMVVRNGTGTPDVLRSVSSPVAETVTVHRTDTDAQGRSVMTEQAELAIPARSSVTFEPGGLHVMLTGITRDLEVGDDVELTLTFEHAGVVDATAEVVEPGASGTGGDGSGGTHDH
ncbi:MAG: hypothetical protein JWO77_3204 [Ilumatobacteraceae bacterium]|nr:hypothetical protein [Ilumatobacteraceae bacterium]